MSIVVSFDKIYESDTLQREHMCTSTNRRRSDNARYEIIWAIVFQIWMLNVEINFAAIRIDLFNPKLNQTFTEAIVLYDSHRCLPMTSLTIEF